MAVRIRNTGEIVCAAYNEAKEGDIYIDDNLHYYLSVEQKVLITVFGIENHKRNGGLWWWKGKEPENENIDPWFYE